MKKILFNSTALLIVLVLISGTVLRSCGEKEAPELPPVSSMLMDFSDFEEGNQGAQKSTEGTYTNWLHAAGNVFAWNLITTVTMSIPVTAYATALNVEPVYIGDNVWNWTYDFTVGSTTYSAKLVGTRISNAEFTMEMYISAAGLLGFDEVLWFEGTIRYDHTHALWTLYENPYDPSPLLTAEYNMDFEADAYDIKYTNIRPENAENGSSIWYSYDPADTVYNSSYVITGSTNTINIEWDRVDKNGRVSDPAFYEDDLWHYWDVLLQDYYPE
ncbi:MAG: hypothetical protein ACOYXB_07600 [Bacteroidota bacterium]